LPRTQRTIKAELELAGAGLFSGEDVTVKLKPAPPNYGVKFVRTDLVDMPVVSASHEFISKGERRTCLKNFQTEVLTVEHILAAFHGLGVDNVVVETSAAEMPSTDGSSAPFVEKILEVGIVEHDVPRRVFNVDRVISVSDGDSTAVMVPHNEGLTITYNLDYDLPVIPRQTYTFHMDNSDFAREIAPARTFCLEAEAEALKRQGFGLRAGYENLLVVGDEGVIENTLRFPDEYARHKILDLIGDLALVGAEINGHIIAYKSGHALNWQLVRELADFVKIQDDTLYQSYLDIRQIQRILPHRYPFLLVDRVIEIDGNKRAVGIKNVTINEPFFGGHWPDQPFMPGVLQIEAMAQLAGVLLLRKLENTGKVAFLLSIDKARLRRPVVPGDQLILEAETRRLKAHSGRVDCRALVNGKVASEAQLNFMLVDQRRAANQPESELA